MKRWAPLLDLLESSVARTFTRHDYVSLRWQCRSPQNASLAHDKRHSPAWELRTYNPAPTAKSTQRCKVLAEWQGRARKDDSGDEGDTPKVALPPTCYRAWWRSEPTQARPVPSYAHANTLGADARSLLRAELLAKIHPTPTPNLSTSVEAAHEGATLQNTKDEATKKREWFMCRLSQRKSREP